MVLCHGGPGGRDELGPVASMLEDRATVYRYEQRGSGRSERRGPYDVASFVADLEALRGHWACESWIVGGWSWGSSLALAYAFAHPGRVRALILGGTVGLAEGWQAEVRERIDAALPERLRARLAELTLLRAAGELDAAGLVEHRAIRHAAGFPDPERDLGRARDEVLALVLNDEVNDAVGADWERIRTSSGLLAAARSFRAPALILHGSLDGLLAWAARELADLLPEARYVEIEGGGHAPWLERPAEVATALRDFVDRLAAR